jgi:hypothetical protein
VKPKQSSYEKKRAEKAPAEITPVKMQSETTNVDFRNLEEI